MLYSQKECGESLVFMCFVIKVSFSFGAKFLILGGCTVVGIIVSSSAVASSYVVRQATRAQWRDPSNASWIFL